MFDSINTWRKNETKKNKNVKAPIKTSWFPKEIKPEKKVMTPNADKIINSTMK